LSRRLLNRTIGVAAIVSMGLLVHAPVALAATWKIEDVFSGGATGLQCRAEGQEGLADHSWISYSCKPFERGTTALWVLN
jgi:hypothetical protein